MICKYCGETLEPADNVCGHCGKAADARVQMEEFFFQADQEALPVNERREPARPAKTSYEDTGKILHIMQEERKQNRRFKKRMIRLACLLLIFQIITMLLLGISIFKKTAGTETPGNNEGIRSEQNVEGKEFYGHN